MSDPRAWSLVEGPSVLDILRSAVPGATLEESPAIDMQTIYVDREHIAEVCRVLRHDPALQFALLAEVTAADYLPREPRFEVVYHLACLGDVFRPETTPGVVSGERLETTPGVVSAPSPSRLRLKVRIPGDDPRVPTVQPVWPAAGWLEREVFDLFGIEFVGHPDLRRILMPDDWEGYPLRKDYAVQIRRDVPTWQPMELSPEEFARNVRHAREASDAAASRSRGPGSGRE